VCKMVPANGQYERELHRRLLEGDPTASSELAYTYLEPLFRSLRRLYPHVDETLVSDAVVDALLALVTNPSSYDPSKSGLMFYLRLSARRDLQNALAKEWKVRRHEILTPVVADQHGLRNKEVDCQDGVAERMDDNHITSAFMQRVRQLLPDPRDAAVLELLLQGERSTRAYARVLGIQEMDPSEQQKVVKRHKDRLKKRLRTIWIRSKESCGGVQNA